MKIREGFVSNSSSSSYTCCLCGRSAIVYDSVRNEAEMVHCIKGHCLCVDETLEEDGLSWQEKRKFCVEKYPDYEWPETESKDLEGKVEDHWTGWYGDSEIPTNLCPVCQFDVLIDSDLHRYLQKVYKIADTEVLDDIKKTNKRRRRIYDPEYVAYVCEKHQLDRTALVAVIKGTFGTYNAFWEYIRS